MKRIDTINLAKEQLILSLIVRAVCSGMVGTLESPLYSVSLGPWTPSREEMDGIDRDRAAWGLEKLATQNLAVALDAALKRVPQELDLCRFVRCLRNAFAHDPYKPTWVLRDPGCRRCYEPLEGWKIDLTERDGTEVQPGDYMHAGGLVRICDAGIGLLRALEVDEDAQGS